MPHLLRDPRVAALRAAQTYDTLAERSQDLEAQLAALDQQVCDAYEVALVELPVAFATCPNAVAWEELYAYLAQCPNVATLLEALHLPGPRDGSVPPTLARS
jgi:hypothetical protein